jgi:hypothetical protein
LWQQGYENNKVRGVEVMSRFIRSTAIGAGLLLASIGQGYAQEDTTPPRLLNLILNTPVIDTTVSDATAVITVRVRDNLSGVALVKVFALWPSQTVATEAECSILNPISELEAIYQCSLSFRQFSPLVSYHFSLDENGED